MEGDKSSNQGDLENIPPPEITSTDLYVGNLPYATRWQELKDLFKEAGDVTYADIPRTPQGRSRGFGIVKFGTIEEAKKASEMFHGTEWHGRRLVIKNDEKAGTNFEKSNQRPYKPRNNVPTNSQNPKPRNPASGNQLFVGNLPWSTTWQDLKDIAKSNGFTPVRADIAVGYDGRSRGWGTLSFASEDEAVKAQSALNGIELDGRIIEVREDNKGR